MARKIILCRCEDVTLADVEHAIALGYATVEEVKRYTGLGTGPCQGKECLRGIVAAIAEAAGCVVTGIHGQPLHTEPHGLLAAADPATHARLLALVTAAG